MKRIGQKQLSLLLCLVLLFTMAIPAGARASDYFNNTYVSATAVGGGTLRIKVDVAASGIMQEGPPKLLFTNGKPMERTSRCAPLREIRTPI